MELHEHSDESLIAYAASHLQHQGVAGMEMQRRLVVALNEFSASSFRQATVMIRLTWAIAVLTVAMTAVAVFQLWSAIK